MGPKLKGQKLTRPDLRIQDSWDFNWGQESHKTCCIWKGGGGKNRGSELRGRKIYGTWIEGTKTPRDLHWRYKKTLETWIVDTKLTGSEMRGKETHGWVRGDKNSQDLHWEDKNYPDLHWGDQIHMIWIEGTNFHQTWIEGTKSHGTWTERDKNSQVLLCLRGQKSQDLKWGDKITHGTFCIEGTSFLGSCPLSSRDLNWGDKKLGISNRLTTMQFAVAAECARASLSLSLCVSYDRPAIPCKSFLSRTQFGDRLQFLYAQLQSQNAHQTAQCRKQLISK
jgi:hypothetical protein